MPLELGYRKIRQESCAERRRAAERVKQMQRHALKLSLRQDELEALGSDIGFNRAAQ